MTTMHAFNQFNGLSDTLKTPENVSPPIFKETRNIHVTVTGYGLTEVNVTHVNTEEESRHNAVGKLLELTEQKVQL